MPTVYNVSPGKTKQEMGIVLNGVSVVDPSVLSWTLQDISAHDAGRDEAGIMHPMKIVEKRTVQLEWNMIDPINASTILNAVSGANQTFSCTLPDAKTAELRTATYYVGDRQAPMQQWMTSRVDGKIYTKVSFTLIEV